MKRLFIWTFISLLYFIDVKSSEALSKERVTDLVIFNDAQELIRLSDSPDNINQLQKAIINNFIAALLEEQLILATKSLWVSFQNMETIWQDYTALSTEEIKNKYQPRDNNIEKVSKIMKEVEDYYQQIEKDIREGKKESEIKDFLTKIPNKNNYAEITAIFQAHCLYQIIISYDYICKDLGNFILFIPKELTLKSGNDKEKNIFIGLSYTELPDFEYKEELSISNQVDIFSKIEQIRNNEKLGEELLNVLKRLIVNKSILNHYPKAELSSFNIIINGHGSEELVAEISMKLYDNLQTKKKTSDVLQLLNFLNSSLIKTKSLLISSCFSGGKKIRDIIKSSLDNPFVIGDPSKKNYLFWNNFFESIKYSIIAVGAFYAPSVGLLKKALFTFKDENFAIYNNHYITKDVKDRLILKKYFQYLNEIPVKYKEAARLFFFEEINFENLASIKLPNLGWFVPIEMTMKGDKNQDTANIYSISQIEALFKKEFTIEKAKRIWLKANYVDKINIPKAYYSLPKFFLVSNNQNYVIEEIIAPDFILYNETASLDTSFFSVIKSFLSVSEILEPINVVIKSLKTKDYSFKNIYIFIYKNDVWIHGDGNYRNGYIYTDDKGNTKIASWLNSDSKAIFNKQQENDYSSEISGEYISYVEKEVKKELEQYGDYKKIENLYGKNYPSHLKKQIIKRQNLLKEAKQIKNDSDPRFKRSETKKQPYTIEHVIKGLDLARAAFFKKSERKVQGVQNNIQEIIKVLDLARATVVQKSERNIQDAQTVARALNLSYAVKHGF